MTLIDSFGRTAIVATSGDVTTYTVGGLTLSFPVGTPNATVLAALAGMAPDGWVPPALPPVVPQSVQLWQLKVVLAGMPGSATGKTKLDDADDLATSIGGAAALFWDNAKEVSRGSVTLAGLAHQIGLTTDAQLDAAFVAANAVALP